VARKILSNQASLKKSISTRATDSRLSSGSIGYSLSLGNNLISYPFQNPTTAYSGNGEPNLPSYEETTGYWTPEEVDAEFDNNIYGITGEGVATTKTNANPGVTGSWVGSLTKIWPRQSYWFTMTGSGTTTKTITKQLIESNHVTTFHPGWNWRSFPFSEYNNIPPSGTSTSGNDIDLLTNHIRHGHYLNQLQGEGIAAIYIGAPFQGTWQGSFTFQTGSGFMVYRPGNTSVNTLMFHRYASTGSDSGESNTDDSGSDNYYTASSDVCFGSSSNYIDTPISNGQFVMGEGAGTFQVYPSLDSYTVRILGKFTGSAGIMSSSILNHDNTQMVTPDEWGTPTGSIAVGMYNLSGSNASNYGTAAAESGSVDDDSVCFGSAMFPSHPDVPSYYQLWFQLNPQLKYTTVSGSVSGSESQVANYPTGSNQTSSLKVYSPKCGQVYMARFYEFTASKSTYSLTDIQNAKDVTSELTGSAFETKWFTKHFIKLRNDVI